MLLRYFFNYCYYVCYLLCYGNGIDKNNCFKLYYLNREKFLIDKRERYFQFFVGETTLEVIAPTPSEFHTYDAFY